VEVRHKEISQVLPSLGAEDTLVTLAAVLGPNLALLDGWEIDQCGHSLLEVI
jgi:hypothetical protein